MSAQILYRGILSTKPVHSWAVVGTELCLALHDLGFNINVHSTNGNAYLHKGLNGLIKSKDEAFIGIGYTIPRNLKLFKTKKRICIYNYETTVLPSFWAKTLNQYADLVLPSSNFAKDIFLHNGVLQDKVHVLPHGVDMHKYNPDIKPIDFNTDKFKFLCVAQPHARKGLDLLLQAYAEEFASVEDVVLILKTKLTGANRAHYEIDVKRLLQSYRQRYAMPEVRIVSEKFDTLAPLYNACDAFVLPSRSECFCLPILEAMACRLPIITTGYGGQTDFATKSNSFLISYKMVKAPKSMQYWHYNSRAQIAEPSVEHLRTLMRYVYNNKGKAQRRADLAYDQNLPKYTWKNVATQLMEIIQKKKWITASRLRRVKQPSEKKEAIDTKALEESRLKSYHKALSKKREHLLTLEKEILQKQNKMSQLRLQIDKAENEYVFRNNHLSKSFSGKILIVVLSYNTKDLLKKNIKSIKDSTEIDYDLIVIDNGSTDGTVEYLKSSGIKYVLNSSNVGVSKGWNQGIKLGHKNSDIVVLNSDIIVSKQWLSKLNKAAYADSSIGIVGCRMKKDYNGKGHLLHTGALIKRNGMGEENEWGIPIPDYGQCQITQDVQIVVGACMYLKRELIDEIGTFDEQFSPAYFEDSDMCMRVKQAGYRVIYCGAVTLYHEHGATSAKNNINTSNLLRTNQAKFLTKWKSFLNKKDVGIEVRGPVYAHGGYAEACRNLVTGLWRENCDILLKPITSHISEQKSKRDVNLIIKDAIQNPNGFDSSLIFYLADFFMQHPKDNKRRIGYTMLEVDGVPESWVKCCNDYLTELWVPSTFNQFTFKKSGVRIPIKIVPLGIDTDRFNPYVQPLLPMDDKFRFLSVCEMGERKNVHLLIRAFQQEFGKDESVQLVLRVLNHDPAINVEKELRQYDLRNVILLSQDYDLHQMPSLYASVDAFVLPSSGEGWGLPFMEAMAVGLPTIGTNWSANTDFMNTKNSYLINVQEIVPAMARCRLYSGFKWALPDIEHLKFLMREIFSNQEEAKAKGMRASRDILEKYNLLQIGRIAKSYLM